MTYDGLDKGSRMRELCALAQHRRLHVLLSITKDTPKRLDRLTVRDPRTKATVAAAYVHTGNVEGAANSCLTELRRREDRAA